MNLLLLFAGWRILLAIAWPLALSFLVLAPLFWLVSLPFRLMGLDFFALFALLKRLPFLPARILGHRG